LRPLTGREITPGSLNKAELERFFRDGLRTFWRQSGTAKMGRDAMSVVDGKLKVYGVAGLRIADASIVSRVTTGNTMAPVVSHCDKISVHLLFIPGKYEGDLIDPN